MQASLQSWPAMASIKLLVLFALTCLSPSHAALRDEVQVYTDEINEPGEFGLELHANATPKGDPKPSYPGEAVNHRGVRFTPEISYGLTPTLEAGLYLPIVRTGDGAVQSAGAKLRLKWLPVKPGGNEGWFAGVNTELGQLKTRFSESSRAVEVRTIVGWKNADWLLAANPIFGWDVSPGFQHKIPDFTLATKLARRVSAASKLGAEYYTNLGRLNQRLPTTLKDNTLYVVWDYDKEPFNFNVGIGRGLSNASDAWTIKTIFELPF